MKRAGKKVKKKVDPVNKTISFTLKDFDELIKEERLIASQKTALMHLVRLAETGHNEDEIVEEFETIMKYCEYVDKYQVLIEEVEEIIYRHTGIKIEF